MGELISSSKIGHKLLMDYIEWIATRETGQPVGSTEPGAPANGEQQVDVFITYKGDFEPLAQRGFRIQSALHNLASGSVRLKDLETLVALDEILHIEKVGQVHLHLDLSIPEIHANSVTVGSPPTTYTGKGVIIGVIDTGLDIDQYAFRTPANQTRILAYWDPEFPRDNNNTLESEPLPFHNGTQYLEAKINEALADSNLMPKLHITDRSGHGSFVTQCAAGNGHTKNPALAPRYVGVAPEADIVFVVNSPEPGGVASYSPKKFGDTLNYIFAIAKRENKPCVVNCSFGEELTPADGTGELDKILDGALNDSSGQPIKGRAIVVSAGNDGNTHRHTRMNFTPNGKLTVNMVVEPIFTIENDTQGDFIDVWYTGAASLDISVIAPDPAKNVGPVKPGNNQVGSFVTIISQPVQLNGKRVIHIALKPNGKPIQRGTWKLLFQETSGTAGVLDVWINRKDGDGYPQMVGWNTIRENTVTSPATANSAIAVGGYGTMNGQEWRMMSASSWGLSDTTGLQKWQIRPTIMAPGIITAPAGGGMKALDLLGGKVQIFWDGLQVMRLSGTSFSAPLVAGVVALMLQRNPNLTYVQIRDILQDTARRDHIPDGIVLPSGAWGAGLVDARAAVNKVTP